MKKLFLSLAAISTIGSSTITVISCGPKEPKNVILEIDGDVASHIGPKADAYTNIVNSYNTLRNNNKLKIEIKFAPANTILNDIRSGDTTPNLYVSYADKVTYYEDIMPKDKIVDMANVINFDLKELEKLAKSAKTINQKIAKIYDSAKNNNEVNDEMNKQLFGGMTLDEVTHMNNEDQYYVPLGESFLQDGTNMEGKMYLAPAGKSFNIGMLNKNLIAEIYEIVTGEIPKWNQRDDIKYFGIDAKEKLKNLRSKTIANLMNELNLNDLPSKNKFRTNQDKLIKDIFEKAFRPQEKLDQEKDWDVALITNAYQDLSILEIVLMVYKYIANQTVDADSKNENYHKSFSMAIKDIVEFVNAMNSTYDKKKIFAKVDPLVNKHKMIIDNRKDEGAESFADTLEFFEFANRLEPLDISLNTPAHPGSLFANGDYSYDYWVRGGMLLSFGSTAGVSFWTTKNPEKDQPSVKAEDIELVDVPTYGDQKNERSIVQQGPGIAMFKSDNVEKNKIAVDFLNYFMQAKNNAEFAITSGYLPSNFHSYYKNEDERKNQNQKSPTGTFYAALTNGNLNPKYANLYKKIVDRLLEINQFNKIHIWWPEPMIFEYVLRNDIIIEYITTWYGINHPKKEVNNAWDFDDFWKKSKKKIQNSTLNLFNDAEVEYLVPEKNS